MTAADPLLCMGCQSRPSVPEDVLCGPCLTAAALWRRPIQDVPLPESDTTKENPRRVKITGDLFHPVVPPGAVKVTRPGRWGNPHPVGKPCTVCGGTVHTLDEALDLFRAHLDSSPALVAEARRVLAGRDLACWCALPGPGEPDRCHAAIWLIALNKEAADA